LSDNELFINAVDFSEQLTNLYEETMQAFIHILNTD